MFKVLIWCFWFITDLLRIWPNCNGLLLFYYCLQQLVITVSSHNTYTSIRCQCIGIPQYLPKHQLLSVYILELMFLHLSNQLMPLSCEDAKTNSFCPEMIHNLNQAGQWRSRCAWFLYRSEQHSACTLWNRQLCSIPEETFYRQKPPWALLFLLFFFCCTILHHLWYSANRKWWSVHRVLLNSWSRESLR